MTLNQIFAILIIHWFCDFVLQTDWQAKNKSKSWEALLNHTGIYSLAFYGLGLFLIPGLTPLDMIIFLFVTFIFHTATDYFTSRLNTKLWTEGKVHYFFVSVGFDQVLHYIQLFLTLKLLTL